MDSSKLTNEHRSRVKHFIEVVIQKLESRAFTHDLSKLVSPEKEGFDQMSDTLKGMEYGSKEYKDSMQKFKQYIDHHQKTNPHHPEFYENGIEGMDLIDIVEMICDWRAATERNKNGDILKSIEINKERFGIESQLYNILLNTVKRHLK